ncbi:TPA: DUF551 domain-containing protein [Salmonella enterica]|nr:DUF551 domain-containing protein [Salmonella enterica]EAX2437465.1 DUF551 domain-containing protein [Salmonella enterica]EBA2080562.1 DUF551 domain-containing protein [Salmonella enterica]EBP1890008.1 DUF551 domain-containing protein [Salmonella enterica]EBR1542896.1 DUF551 domain-containing protein [Salmonella enterica]
MTTITKERLLKIQHWRETYGADSNVMLPAEEAEELARIALASLEAKPVAWECGENIILFNPDTVEAYAKRVEISPKPLYAAPPAPVVPDGYALVPVEPTDEMIAAAMNCEDVLFNSDESFCVQFGNIYEAMLAAAPKPQNAPQNIPENIPAGKSTLTLDGWISCSERMPEDEQEVIVQNKLGYRYVSYFDEQSGLFFDMRGGNQINCIEHILVTHWMPLPAPPQQ